MHLRSPRGGALAGLAAPALLAATLASQPSPAAAQATANSTPDDHWHFALGAGATIISGNSESRSLNFSADGVRQSDNDRLNFYGRALEVKTPDQRTRTLGLGGQYNRDFTPLSFGFTKYDYLEDPPSNLASRNSLAFGLGHHLIRSETNTLDLTAGLAGTVDRYETPTVIADATRTRYARAEGIFGEASEHKLTPTTTLKQKLEVHPNLRDQGQWRAEFDAGLSVAMTHNLNLTTSLNHRYDSDPGVGVGRTDTRFVTGISMKLD
jgi:putative salt-induced outer membrane protein